MSEGGNKAESKCVEYFCSNGTTRGVEERSRNTKNVKYLELNFD